MIISEEHHNNNTRHLRDLIELEIYYPTNVLAVLRTLPAADLATLERIFGKMQKGIMLIFFSFRVSRVMVS